MYPYFSTRATKYSIFHHITTKNPRKRYFHHGTKTERPLTKRNNSDSHRGRPKLPGDKNQRPQCTPAELEPEYPTKSLEDPRRPDPTRPAEITSTIQEREPIVPHLLTPLPLGTGYAFSLSLTLSPAHKRGRRCDDWRTIARGFLCSYSSSVSIV